MICHALYHIVFVPEHISNLADSADPDDVTHSQCSHSKFKLGVFIPTHTDNWGYEMKFEGMTFWDEKIIDTGNISF